MTSLKPNATLRVLLVCQAESLRIQIDEILSIYAGNYQSYWISQPELALARVETLLPHVVLIDDDLGVQAMQAMIRQMADHAPGVPMMALIDEEAIADARQAVMAGAQAFAIKPLVAEEFWEAIRLVMDGQSTRSKPKAPPTSKQTARTVVFCAPKGGTGRTTITVNTAIALIQQPGQSVALIDADYSAPALDVVLNLRDDHDITDLLTRLSGLDPQLMASVLSVHASGLEVLLAPPPGSLNWAISPSQIDQIMGQLEQMFDWVVVDLGLPLDDTAFAFLDMADRIIMTVLPEMVCLRNTRLMLDQFQDRDYVSEKTWLVLNRDSIRGGISRHDIEKYLHIPVKLTIPDDQPLVSHSINRGVPLVISDQRSAVANAMAELATSLGQERSGATKPVPQPVLQPATKQSRFSNGLFQRLRFRTRPIDAQ